MKDRITTSLRLFRDVPLALAYTIIWVVVLWAAQYPMDERVGVAIIAYIALWLSKLIIGYGTVALLRALRNYGLRTAEQAGIEISGAGQARNSTGVNAVAVVFLLAVITTILGCSFVPTAYIAPAYGMTPLNPYFATIGWIMLIGGVSALTLFFALSYILFKSVESLNTTEALSKPSVLSSRIIRINESETLVQRLAA